MDSRAFCWGIMKAGAEWQEFKAIIESYSDDPDDKPIALQLGRLRDLVERLAALPLQSVAGEEEIAGVLAKLNGELPTRSEAHGLGTRTLFRLILTKSERDALRAVLSTLAGSTGPENK